ncbi:hypothetical protein JCM19046_3367 [Bacillus sp. JCM 19046]|nr:hypothetical protein JCM19046_3367 [Bacillus sp. JCM 19046]
MTNSRLLDAIIAFTFVSVTSFIAIYAIEGGNYSLADNWLKHVLYGVGPALLFALVFPLLARKNEQKRQKQR